MTTEHLDTCPNCSEPIDGHPKNGCALRTLIQVVKERGEVSDEDLRKLHLTCDADKLWDDLGPVADNLQSGQYVEDDDEFAKRMEEAFNNS